MKHSTQKKTFRAAASREYTPGNIPRCQISGKILPSYYDSVEDEWVPELAANYHHVLPKGMRKDLKYEDENIILVDQRIHTQIHSGGLAPEHLEKLKQIEERVNQKFPQQ